MLITYGSAVRETTGKTATRVIFGNYLQLPIDWKFGINAGRNAKEVNSIVEAEVRAILVHTMGRRRTKNYER